jgi:hypothetical protein
MRYRLRTLLILLAVLPPLLAVSWRTYREWRWPLTWDEAERVAASIQPHGGGLQITPKEHDQP